VILKCLSRGYSILNQYSNTILPIYCRITDILFAYYWFIHCQHCIRCLCACVRNATKTRDGNSIWICTVPTDNSKRNCWNGNLDSLGYFICSKVYLDQGRSFLEPTPRIWVCPITLQGLSWAGKILTWLLNISTITSLSLHNINRLRKITTTSHLPTWNPRINEPWRTPRFILPSLSRIPRDP